MTARVVVGIVALVCCGICGFVSSIANLEMADKVNEMHRAQKRLEFNGWYFAKEYRKLFPNGPLHRKVAYSQH